MTDGQAGAKRKKVVFLTWEYWGGPIHISAHALARCFAEQGWQVAFVTVPVSPLHRIVSPGVQTRGRLALNKAGGKWDLDNKLMAWMPRQWFPPQSSPGHGLAARLYRKLAAFDSDLTTQTVHKLVDQGFMHADLVILDCAYFLETAHALKPEKLIFRLTDLTNAFPGMHPDYEMLERQAAQAANMVTYSADPLATYADWLGAQHKTYCPHGVSYSIFTQNLPVPKDYKRLPKGPIALYVGTIADWFDFDSIEKAARQRPDMQFVLIGSANRAPQNVKTWCRKLPNLHWFGVKPHATIPAYMQHADIGLIPFNLDQNDQFVQAINPVKLYEYWASGLHVISAPMNVVKSLARDMEQAGLPKSCHFYESPAGLIRHLAVISPAPNNEEKKSESAQSEQEAVSRSARQKLAADHLQSWEPVLTLLLDRLRDIEDPEPAAS